MKKRMDLKDALIWARSGNTFGALDAGPLLASEITRLNAQLEQAALAYQQDMQVKNVEIHVLNAQLDSLPSIEHIKLWGEELTTLIQQQAGLVLRQMDEIKALRAQLAEAEKGEL